MEGSPLGSSGLEVSRVGLGCNNFGRRLDRNATAAVVAAALDAGVTFFDTADVYGGGDSERFLGASLASRRDEVVIASKFGQDTGVPGPGGSREHVRSAIDASLDRLENLLPGGRGLRERIDGNRSQVSGSDQLIQ